MEKQGMDVMLCYCRVATNGCVNTHTRSVEGHVTELFVPTVLIDSSQRSVAETQASSELCSLQMVVTGQLFCSALGSCCRGFCGLTGLLRTPTFLSPLCIPQFIFIHPDDSWATG